MSLEGREVELGLGGYKFPRAGSEGKKKNPNREYSVGAGFKGSSSRVVSSRRHKEHF